MNAVLNAVPAAADAVPPAMLRHRCAAETRPAR